MMKTQKFAERLAALDRETSLEMLARARALEERGREMIHMEIGEPDFPTPANITQAAIRALEAGYTHYGPPAGLGETRDAIAQYISKDRQITVERDQVVVTPGAKPMILFTALALINAGDEVIYPDPGFPNYESVVNFVGGKPVALPLDSENGFAIDLDQLESLITKRTRLCIINSPHNPTGAVMPRDTLEGIAELSRKHDFFVLSDEIYSKITYTDAYTSFFSLPGVADRTVLLDGCSKTYAMTGWRLGYGVMPPDLATQVSRIMSNSNSCTCSFVQMAAIEALQGPQQSVLDMVKEFRVRRDLIVEGLNSVKGIDCQQPEGAFYVFPNIEGTGKSSKVLESFLMEKAGVAVLSGTTFGSSGEGFVRVSYANSQDAIRRAIEKMDVALHGQ